MEWERLTLAAQNRWRDAGRDVARGAEALDLIWPAWWWATSPYPLRSGLALIALAEGLVYAAGYRNLHRMEAREYGWNYFFEDENEAAVAHWNAVIRGRWLDRRGEALAGLAARYEREWES